MASDGEEDFVSYGVPLEPLEEDEARKRPVPLHDQMVKDEKGRFQRFHGAFTGGFSAGYFNTVGTKEGWAPSTFVSSRQQKSEKQNARPEDFMDEEDFGEHGIAPSQIRTSQEFTSSRTDKTRETARAVNAQNSVITGDTKLEELIAPARSSVGVEILRRMGWRQGQGVGPRVKRKPRRQHPDGSLLPPAGSEDSEDEDEFAPEDVTFAPKDVTPVDFTPRGGLQGLGYRGLDPGRALMGRAAPEHIDLFRPQSEARSRLFGGRERGAKRGGVAGTAFGIGALEDDDDEEVYHRDSMSRYDKELGGEEPGDGLYGWTAPQQYTKKREKSKDASYLGKILEGFTLAQNTQELKTIFPPPCLPPDFRPIRRVRPPPDVSHLSGVSPALAEALRLSRGHMVPEVSQQGVPQQGSRHQLDSGQRRALLGEDALQGPSSVLELLKPEDRKRLLDLRTSTPNSTSHDALRRPDVGVGLQQEALTAWRGVPASNQSFRPFDKDPSKQARYDLYLNCLKQGDRDGLEQSLDPGMTEWERSRERDEFVRASILYRPSSSFLSSRFTRAKRGEEEQQEEEEEGKEQEVVVDDQQAAVNMKMFGKLTRETFEWHPDKLLCKRFNIPDPHPGSGFVGLHKVKRDKFSVFNFLSVPESRDTPAPPKPPESGRRSRWDQSQQKEEQKKEEEEEEQKKKDPLSELLSAARNQTANRAEDPERKSKDPDEKKGGEEEEEEEEEESRPPLDLFKAIFASSSDESSSSSEEEANEEEEGREEQEVKVETQLFNISSSSSSIPSSSSSIPSSSSSI
ncbi:G patch domain-containing protein 1, partial [Trematomus bernacchii]|uniref:G patch domain-containing protein 1 n=1 Tax=Trematomus bernacchii TaxID=40690 RepID=UPI00146A7447